MAVVLLALALSGGVVAPAQAAVIVTRMSQTERAMLADNPLLAELAATAPDQLREILDGISDALARPAATRGGLEQLDQETVRLFGQNPVLLQVWRSSPEASADLLELIRVAAGGGKPKK